MIANPFLAEMELHDIDRRYTDTLVRYNGEIVYINRFLDRHRFEISTPSKSKTVAFDPMLLDISRPMPRWVIAEETAWYLNYLYIRQWHRGFCRNNTVIRHWTGRNESIPSSITMLILQKMYDEPNFRLSCSSQQVLDNVQKNNVFLLSPKVLIADDKSGQPPLVFFREAYIGRFGSVDPNFDQEIRELIGDYVNADNAKPFSGKQEGAKKDFWRREIAAERAPEDVAMFFDDPELNALVRAGREARQQREQEQRHQRAEAAIAEAIRRAGERRG